MDGRAHSVSWVNEWTLAEPVPKGLGMIVGTIQHEYDNASEPSMDNGKRRITETMVKQSASHNAEGHALHQAAYLLLAKSRLCLQWRAVTFTTNRSVDILVYHDVTDQADDSSNGIAYHVVNSRSYAVTTLLRNATSGTVNFAG
jgi:hypothetical protein